MASPSRKIEEKLAALKAMERSAELPDASPLLEALRSKTGVLVAAAARIVSARELRDLSGELAAAFERLCEKPLERDPGCRGKLAVVKALGALDEWEDRVFVRGISLVQAEPVWGGREDAAAELRAECGMAFSHAGRADALDVLADLLADPQRAARAGAAQALGDSGRPDATALLRFKVRTGDSEAEVLSACLASLLALDPKGSVPFLASLLRGRDERAEAAALALGESRLAAARPHLEAWCEEGATPDERRNVGYLALALLRDDEATGFLLRAVRDEDDADAVAAARALATFRDDPALVARLREAASGRGRVAAAADEALAARRG